MHFVIAGRVNCPQFSYAVMVAQRLKEHLPDFGYLKIPKKPGEWERWLVGICKENEWYHIKSPLIWRELGLKNGKKDFIGDVNKFLDLCYDYYGVPRDALSAECFNRGEIDWFTKRTESEFFEDIRREAKRKREYRSRQVCITGACSQVAEIIIMELLQLDVQKREDGLEIRLFDEPTKEMKLASSANDAKHCPGSSGFGNCRAVQTMKEALTNVDLVIVLDSFARRPRETLVKWLKRNRNAMCALGKALNEYAPPHCRVIIGSPSSQPICYNATVLASYATKLHVRNIVAVTQDLGREALKFLSNKTNTPLRNFYCPPVWGFVGLNKFVDIRKTLQTHIYKLPGKHPNSTLPQGTEEYELRTIECLINEEDIHELNKKVSVHKGEAYPQIGRFPCLAKATAIIDLLKVWGLKQEDGNGEILCLGVYSDGTFNIPKGIYWSQPVILKDGFWVPFEDFPIPRTPYFNCYYLFVYSVAAIYRTKVKPRIYVPPKKLPKPKESTKFNFDQIAEELGMPVIRTDSECAIYLKYLAKKELGIDLDRVSECIEEEDESIVPEVEVIQKQIYCECWRQELKELQKIVFDRSSTTEVEVDLSDNISGSEWSVINTAGQSEVSIKAPLGSETVTKSLTGKVSTSKSEIAPPEAKSEIASPSSDLTRSTVCSCGRLSTGSICRCLGVPEVPDKQPDEEIVSTEPFYEKQTAEVLEEEDSKNLIYADTYEGDKQVTFAADAKQEDLTGFHVKFYGRKDAIRDVEADLKMKKRILRYERGGEDSVEEEGEIYNVFVGEGEKTPVSSLKIEDGQDQKFQISIDGAPYEIIGDQSGLEGVGRMGRESGASFRDMYGDEITPSIRVIPQEMEKSEDGSSGRDLSFLGEGRYIYRTVPEMPGEEYSIGSLRQELEEIWDENTLEVETEKGDEDREKAIKRKWEGIPLCCLCRCIVPEGLPCCPCGATTVVEVFKKESVEVFIQAEDDMSYRLEYYETELPPDVQSDTGLDMEEEEPQPRELPPESFLPFSPKLPNKFMGATRPLKLTKEYIDSLKEPDNSISPLCSELLRMAKANLEAETNKEEEGEEGEEAEKEKEEVEADKENLPPVCEPEEQIKTDFSDLKLFIPCGLEDWRLTVQRKYREWFFQGPKTKDDSYYDIAIEDVSEDEFEVDKEIEQYFEN